MNVGRVGDFKPVKRWRQRRGSVFLASCLQLGGQIKGIEQFNVGGNPSEQGGNGGKHDILELQTS
jgi:hypothetical protein